MHKKDIDIMLQKNKLITFETVFNIKNNLPYDIFIASHNMSTYACKQRPIFILPYLAEVIKITFPLGHVALNVSQLQYSREISECQQCTFAVKQTLWYLMSILWLEVSVHIYRCASDHTSLRWSEPLDQYYRWHWRSPSCSTPWM